MYISYINNIIHSDRVALASISEVVNIKYPVIKNIF